MVRKAIVRNQRSRIKVDNSKLKPKKTFCKTERENQSNRKVGKERTILLEEFILLFILMIVMYLNQIRKK